MTLLLLLSLLLFDINGYYSTAIVTFHILYKSSFTNKCDPLLKSFAHLLGSISCVVPKTAKIYNKNCMLCISAVIC